MGQTLLRVSNVSKSYGQHDIFSGISFSINTGERVALVGPNGVGKTTLARCLAGLEPVTSGHIHWLHDRLVLGYLPQKPELSTSGSAQSILDTTATCIGVAARCTVNEALKCFGFTGGEEDLPVTKLSGGQKTRLLLAQTWLSLPDLLILDEPTNHLDQEGSEQLADLIQGYPHSVLIISHDRYFLDQVATRVLELHAEGITEYTGNYSDYRRQKQALFEQQRHRYQNEQKEIRRIEEAIDRQMRWFKQAHDQADCNTEIRSAKDFYKSRAKKAAARAKATIKRLERAKSASVVKPKEEESISLQLSQQQRSGSRIFLAENMGKAFARPLFQNTNFAIMRGDKVGIVGANGVGKTTLLRLLLGIEQPSSGTIWATPALKAGYLEQEMLQLQGDNSLVNSILKLFPNQRADLGQRVRQLLTSFLFPSDTWNKPLAVLSEGERRRIALICMLLGEYNVLLLDEPTNHLDLPAREKLEEAMVAYNGTLVLISHDRYLVQNVCNKILAIQDGGIRVYPGTYKEYLRWREQAITTPSLPGPSMSPEERLVMENRQAWLAAQLGMEKDPLKQEKLRVEYITLSRTLYEAKP